MPSKTPGYGPKKTRLADVIDLNLWKKEARNMKDYRSDPRKPIMVNSHDYKHSVFPPVEAEAYRDLWSDFHPVSQPGKWTAVDIVYAACLALSFGVIAGIIVFA